jgi:hypothetical protein
LIGFTVALPLSIGVYLFVHRGELFSTAVYQRVGFLYLPYNRSAPLWAIHDVVLKMLLTGMLICKFVSLVFHPSLARLSVLLLLNLSIFL